MRQEIESLQARQADLVYGMRADEEEANEEKADEEVQAHHREAFKNI